jgi:hypothetical protein
MLTAQLAEEPSLWDKLTTGVEEVQTGAKKMVVRDLADKAQKDVAKFGYWGVVAGTMFATTVSYFAFLAAGTQRPLAGAAIIGSGSALLGAVAVSRIRKGVAEIPQTMDLPIHEKIARMKPVWFAIGTQASHV